MDKRIAARIVVGGALFCVAIVVASEPELPIWSAQPVLGAFAAF